MGGRSSRIAFEICAVTTDFKIGEDSPIVKLSLFDHNGEQSPVFTLENLFATEEDGSIRDKFTIPMSKWCKKFGSRIDRIEFKRSDVGMRLDWFCEKIIVRDRRKGLGGQWVHYFFPFHNWVLPDVVYSIHNLEAFFLNNDPQPDRRQLELKFCKELYINSQRSAGLPVELQIVPDEEILTSDSRWDIEQTKDQIVVQKGLDYEISCVDHWESFEVLNEFYQVRGFTRPSGLDYNSMNDVCFGAQRVRGVNPFMIKLCKDIPSNFGVAVDWLKPYLEGWTLKHIVDAKRLFLVDFKILEGIEVKPGRQMCAPLGLFFVTEARQVKPLALQLNQEIEEGNPVFIPTDSVYAWTMAKLWFNMADGCYSLIVNRLLPHLILEGMYAAMRRNLPISHPLYKLLAPHFRHLVAVNKSLKDWFFNDDGWIGQNIQYTRKGVRQLLRKAFKGWRFDQHAHIYRELESRGVYDTKALPQYPYRDDAIPIFKAIHAYVTKIVRLYYANSVAGNTREKLLRDAELQAWRKECSAPLEQGGLGLQGLPGQDGLITCEETAGFLSSILYLIVIAVQAARAPQYDEEGYPANQPLSLHGRLPSDPVEDERSIQDVLQSLPTKRESVDTLLSMRLCHKANEVIVGATQLGCYEVEYIHEPEALQCYNEFKEALRSVNEATKARNQERDPIYKYIHLIPENMPNFVGI